MTWLTRVGGVVAVAVAVGGCRTATRIAEYPRVDLDVSSASGNRGYLVGTPPPAKELKTTRQLVETDVELPSFSPPKRGAIPAVTLGDVAPPEIDLSEETPILDDSAPQAYDIYLVKKGETLWSIAADPKVFGDATKWRLLFESNRDTLKSPDRLRPGMALKIPRADGAHVFEAAQAEPSGTYEK